MKTKKLNLGLSYPGTHNDCFSDACMNELV